MRMSMAVALSLVLASCGGDKSGSSPTQSSPVVTPAPTTAGRLPLGTATAVDGGCPTESPSGNECKRMTVACPSIASASATLRITPVPGAVNRGTILLTTGGAGTVLNGAVMPLGPQMVRMLAGDGMTVVELAWDGPGIWGGPQARTLACRYATAARWVYDHIHSGGRATLFAAQGTSGGASQIAFALAHYGQSDIVALANLGGGPPGCPLCSPDGQHGPEPLLPGQPPSVNRDPELSYPGTAVRFFLGDSEPTPDIIADANAYLNAIASSKSMTIVSGTGHDIESTQAGVDAYVESVRNWLTGGR